MICLVNERILRRKVLALIEPENNFGALTFIFANICKLRISKDVDEMWL